MDFILCGESNEKLQGNFLVKTMYWHNTMISLVETLFTFSAKFHARITLLLGTLLTSWRRRASTVSHASPVIPTCKHEKCTRVEKFTRTVKLLRENWTKLTLWRWFNIFREIFRRKLFRAAIILSRHARRCVHFWWSVDRDGLSLTWWRHNAPVVSLAQKV